MRLRVALYCLLGGVVLLVPALEVGHLLWWYLSGVILAASFVPVALFGPWTVRGQFGIIFPILFIVTVLTTWSEGLVFVKLPLIHEHPIRNLFSETALYLVVAIVLAVLSRALKLAHDSGKTFPRRSLAKTAGILVICAVATLSLARSRTIYLRGFTIRMRPPSWGALACGSGESRLPAAC